MKTIFKIFKRNIFLCYGITGLIVLTLFNFYGLDYELPYDDSWLQFLVGMFFRLPFWIVTEFLTSISGTPLANPYNLSLGAIYTLGLILCIILDFIQSGIRKLIKKKQQI